jgi:hypothetical protein
MTKRLKVFITDDDSFFVSAIELIIQAEEGMEVVGKPPWARMI